MNKLTTPDQIHRVKNEGGDNNLLELVLADPYFDPIKARVESGDLLEHKSFVGRAVEQVEEFISEEVQPVLEKYSQALKNAKESKLAVWRKQPWKSDPNTTVKYDEIVAKQ